MPHKDKQILRLIFFEELEKDEVCRIYRVDRDYLRVLLHRAKNRFRQVYLGVKWRRPSPSVSVIESGKT